MTSAAMETTVNPATTNSQILLRRALLADGVASAAAGALLALAADPLADLLGLPAALLRLAGLSLLPFAAAAIYLATRPIIPRRFAWAVVIVNLLWVAGSLILLIAGWVEPTTFGYAFVIAQAVAVLAFAELQYFGLRRAA